MFKSPTYGKLHIEQIPDKILTFYLDHTKYDAPVHIIVGTDSQNFDDTKIVSVVAVICEGHGGMFFYEITRRALIRDVRTENDKKYEEMYLNCPIAIHVDAGNSRNGKTRELIPELVGWIRACGYDCSIKPDSFVASTIADRISK